MRKAVALASIALNRKIDTRRRCRLGKLVLLGTVIAAAVPVMVVHHGYNSFEPVGGNAIAASGIDSRQQISAPADRIVPSRDRHDISKTFDIEYGWGSEYGWGPLRLVDW